MSKTASKSKAGSRTVADVLAEAKDKKVKRVRLQFVDLHGHPKNMSIHADQLEKALNNDVLLDGSSIQGFRTIETSDMAFHPDLSTFQVMPWKENDQAIARVICDIHNPDGTPFDGCPRNNLKRVLAEAEKLGFIYNVGPELEFFLTKINEDPDYPLEPPIGRSRRPETARRADPRPRLQHPDRRRDGAGVRDAQPGHRRVGAHGRRDRLPAHGVHTRGARL